MLLRRVFVEGSVDAGNPVVDHVKVLSAGERWHVTPRLVEKGIAEGWMTVGRHQIVLKTAPGDPPVAFRIERAPNKDNRFYSCVREANG